MLNCFIRRAYIINTNFISRIIRLGYYNFAIDTSEVGMLNENNTEHLVFFYINKVLVETKIVFKTL